MPSILHRQLCRAIYYSDKAAVSSAMSIMYGRVSTRSRKARVNINMKSCDSLYYGHTPLVVAIVKVGHRNGDVDDTTRRIDDAFDIVEILLQNGADPNIGDPGETALQIIFRYSGFEDTSTRQGCRQRLVRLLVAYGADVNGNSGSRSPLCWACFENDTNTAMVLLEQVGIDVNRSHSDRSALSWASSHGNIELMRSLITAGADPNGNTAFIYDNMGTRIYHRQYGDTNLHYVLDRDFPSTFSTQLGCVKILLEAGADPNIGNMDFRTVLHNAAWDNRYVDFDSKIINVLLGAGANPNSVDRYGEIPLHLAAYGSSVNNVTALLDAGSDYLHENNDGETPLRNTHYGRLYVKEFDIITALVAAGDRSWECVPTPCPGLEAAMLSVWKNAPDEFPELVKRLENPPQSMSDLFPRLPEEIKEAVHAVLRGTYIILPCEAIRVILNKTFGF